MVTGAEKIHLQELIKRQDTDLLAYQEGYQQPLDIYGLVLDQQSEQPIVGAFVRLAPIDQPGIGSKNSAPTTLQTDMQGRFSYTGHRGLALGFSVYKAGYYNLPGQSSGTFVHDAPDAHVHNIAFAPDPANPTRLYLRQQGTPATKLVERRLSQLLPHDGSPREIKLASGREVRVGVGDLRVECTGTGEGVRGGIPFDWHCRISVPGGGLQERTNEFAFQAPEGGYQPNVEVNMPASLGINHWEGGYAREYFFRLGNGCYARGTIDVHPDGKHLFYLDCYYNPTPGDRNLEYNPEAAP